MTKRSHPPDAIPGRYRSNVIPPAAVGVPEPIREANEALRVAGLAAQDARMRRHEAEQAAKRAPRDDTNAAIAAVREGKDPPPPTAQAREAEADTARRALEAANNIATAAAADLERAIRAHGAEWLEAQREDAATCARDALDALAQLDAAIGRLGESAGIARTLGTAPPPGPVIERGRTFKRFTVAQANGKTAPNLIADLREAITDAVPQPPPEPTVAEQLEADDFKRRQRGLRDVGRGVAV